MLGMLHALLWSPAARMSISACMKGTRLYCFETTFSDDNAFLETLYNSFKTPVYISLISKMRDKTEIAVLYLSLVLCNLLAGVSASARFLPGPSVLLGGQASSVTGTTVHVENQTLRLLLHGLLLRCGCMQVEICHLDHQTNAFSLLSVSIAGWQVSSILRCL